MNHRSDRDRVDLATPAVASTDIDADAVMDDDTDTSGPRSHRRRMSLRSGLAVAVCVLGALLAGTGWALSSPVGSSPDDDYHQVSIWCADSYERADCTRVGVSEKGGPIVRVPALLTAGACYAGDSTLSAECQEEVVVGGALGTDRVNTVDYPGGYYRVMHVFASEDIPASVIAMRLFNVMMAVALFSALALSGTKATQRIQLYTLGAVLIPLGWFLIASINPSGWAITGVTVFGFGMHSALVVRSRARLVTNIALAGSGAVVATSARSDSAVYIVIVSLSMCLLHWRTLWRRRRLLLIPAVAVVVCAAVALSSAQVASVASPEPATARSGAEVLVQLMINFPLLISGLFGYGWGLGWLDTWMPALTVCSVMSAVGFLGLSGAARFSWGKSMAVLTLGGAFLAIPLLTLYRARLFVGEGLQPRYLLPLAPVLLLMLLTGRRVGRGLRLTRVQAVVLWLMLSTANAAALYTNMWRYVTGTDEPTLWADVEWWWGGWPAPVTTWVLASLGFACFALSLILVSWRSDGAAPTRTKGISCPTEL